MTEGERDRETERHRDREKERGRVRERAVVEHQHYAARVLSSRTEVQ